MSDLTKTSSLTMQKKIILIIVLILSGIGAWLIGRNLLNASTSQQAPQPTTNPQLQIYTSFYPLYFFTKEIAGDKAHVYNLTQTGIEPHDFEPNTQDLAAMSQASLVIANGLGFEPWLEKFAENIPTEKLLLASQDITPELIIDETQSEHAEHESHEKETAADEHNHVGTDPHVWLDPQLAAQQVVAISERLQSIDSQHASLYRANTQELLEKLRLLDQQLSAGLSSCKQRHIITAHQAFAYLAKQYNFEQLSILGINPEEEPSPAALAQLTNLAKEYGITHVFFETNLSPKLAETLAQEVGATTLVFHPLENLNSTELTAGENYFSIQTRNLNNLRTAMNCQ